MIGRDGAVPWVLAMLAGLLVTFLGCRQRAPAPVRADAVQARVAATAGPPDDAAAHPALDAASKGRIELALTNIRIAVKCNRVMGCKPLTDLIQYGKAAVPAIISELEAGGSTDAYWVAELEDLLGELGDARGRGVLEGFLRGDRWEMRAHAALALGKIGGDRSRQALHDALVRARTRHHIPTQAAILAAMATMGAKVDGASSRDALIKLLNGLSRAELMAMNPGYLMFLAGLIGQARVSEALPVARLAATSDNSFVTKAALSTLGALQDTGGIADAVNRLGDPLPSVRRAAIHCLQRITGSRHISTAAQWRAWCAKRTCLTRYRGATPK